MALEQETLDLPEHISQADADEQAGIIYGYLGGQITLADTKAQLTLAADALLASALLGANQNYLAQLVAADTGVLDRLAAVAMILMFISLIMSIYYSLRVARPTLPPSKKPNLYYFVDVSRMSEPEFRTQFLTQTPDQVTDALLYEVYLLSKIAFNKFNRIRLSLNWLVAAFILWAIAQGLNWLSR
jgi:hypothetical protein